MHGLVKERR